MTQARLDSSETLMRIDMSEIEQSKLDHRID